MKTSLGELFFSGAVAGARTQELFNLLAEMEEPGNTRGLAAFQGSQASKEGNHSSKKKQESDPDHKQQQRPGQQEQHPVGRKNDKRDLERKLLKNSAWLRGYEAAWLRGYVASRLRSQSGA